MATRGRKPIEVTPVELQEVIRQVESTAPDGKFPNRSALWQAIEQTVWAKSRQPRPLTAQVAMLIAQKNNLVMNTVPGLKGRQKGCGPVPGAGKRKRKETDAEIIIALKNAVPKGYEKTVARACAGSMKAAIKLKCLDCVCFERKEVALCTIKDCSLYNFRPYKNVNRISLTQVEENENATDSTGTPV